MLRPRPKGRIQYVTAQHQYQTNSCAISIFCYSLSYNAWRCLSTHIARHPSQWPSRRLPHRRSIPCPSAWRIIPTMHARVAKLFAFIDAQIALLRPCLRNDLSRIANETTFPKLPAKGRQKPLTPFPHPPSSLFRPASCVTTTEWSRADAIRR